VFEGLPGGRLQRGYLHAYIQRIHGRIVPELLEDRRHQGAFGRGGALGEPDGTVDHDQGGAEAPLDEQEARHGHQDGAVVVGPDAVGTAPQDRFEAGPVRGLFEWNDYLRILRDERVEVRWTEFFVSK
jgi:hypothetical protein